MRRVLVIGPLVGLDSASPPPSLDERRDEAMRLSLERELEYLFEPDTYPPEQLAEKLSLDSSIEALICPLSQRVTAEVFARAPQLKVVANIAVGLNNIDLED